VRKFKAKRLKQIINFRWCCPDCLVRLGGPELSGAEMRWRIRQHRKEVHGIPSVPAGRTPVGTRAFPTCPECGVSVRVDRLSRHLRRVHKKDGAAGKIRVNDLARELGIKSAPIMAYLAELGQQHRSHSNSVDDGVAAKVRERFQVTPDPLEDVNASSQPGAVLHGRPENLAKGLTKQLREYDEWTSLSRHPGRPAQALTKQQQAALQVDFPVERLSFKLLPPGTWDMEYLIAYYRREAHRFPADIRSRGIDPTRLETIYKSLRPAKCYRGEEQWHGYHAFEIPGTSRVVLECPMKGNATYVLWGDWQRMAAQPKSYIWKHFPQNYRKIIHRDKRKWLARTKRALKLR